MCHGEGSRREEGTAQERTLGAECDAERHGWGRGMCDAL